MLLLGFWLFLLNMFKLFSEGKCSERMVGYDRISFGFLSCKQVDKNIMLFHEYVGLSQPAFHFKNLVYVVLKLSSAFM